MLAGDEGRAPGGYPGRAGDTGGRAAAPGRVAVVAAGLAPAGGWAGGCTMRGWLTWGRFAGINGRTG